MNYWETLEDNRKRGGVYDNDVIAEKAPESERKINQTPNTSPTSSQSFRWEKRSDGAYSLFIPAGTEYNLWNLVRVSLPASVNAHFSVPLLEKLNAGGEDGTITQKLLNLAKQSGNMITITVDPNMK